MWSLVRAPHMAMTSIAGLLERLRHRQQLGDTDAAADAHDRADLVDVTRLAERTEHVGEAVTLLHRGELLGGRADGLDD